MTDNDDDDYPIWTEHEISRYARRLFVAALVLGFVLGVAFGGCVL